MPGPLDPVSVSTSEVVVDSKDAFYEVPPVGRRAIRRYPVPDTHACDESSGQSSKADQPPSTDDPSLGDAGGGDGHSTVNLGSMQAIDGLGVRWLPPRSASTDAKRTQALAVAYSNS